MRARSSRCSRSCNVEGVAICLINAYVSAAHEERLRALTHDVLGDDVAVSISAEVSPLAKEYPRASTTVVDVFMKLIYTKYSDRLAAGLTELGFPGQLNFADCAAQLVARDHAMAAPFRVVFSGPAAGTVSAAHFGERIGADNLICADVGGTSCDISIVTDGQPTVNTTFELEHDLVVNALSTEISSSGAGGGSIVSINRAGEIQVGPGSAGADPGPAAYGKGGTEPTMSDAFLLIGILDPGRFAGGSLSLDAELARQAFETLDSSLDLGERVAYAYRMGLNNIAEGIVDISIGHGVDPRDYSLLAFGAAGPMMLPGAAGRDPRARASSSRRTRACSPRWACCPAIWSTPTAAARTRSSAPTRRAPSTTSSPRWRRACAPSSGAAWRASSSSARWTPAWSARPGRRRSSPCPAGRSTRPRSRR